MGTTLRSEKECVGLLVFAWLEHRVSWGGGGEVWKLKRKQMKKVSWAVLSVVNVVLAKGMWVTIEWSVGHSGDERDSLEEEFTEVRNETGS